MEIKEAGRSWTRMEEEAARGNQAIRRSIGFYSTRGGDPEDEPLPQALHPEIVADLVRSLAHEREAIVASEKLSAREKLSLLGENTKALTIATGGSVTKTDSVVYGILIFGGAVLVILALLTAFHDLPKEVTVSFVGTVLGGVIATIAQKLGKI